jgi:hypothetical protein
MEAGMICDCSSLAGAWQCENRLVFKVLEYDQEREAELASLSIQYFSSAFLSDAPLFVE